MIGNHYILILLTIYECILLRIHIVICIFIIEYVRILLEIT